MEQRSPEWYAARLGKATASRIADLMARTKTGYGASRANYMAELIVERLTGMPTDGFTSAAMQWGIDHEDEAKAAYYFEADRSIEPAGFVDHPIIAMAGASPDGYICDGKGLIELKCPNTATHIQTLLADKVDGKYYLQIQFQLACTTLDFCDYVSFDPRMPPEMQLWWTRIHRDDERIAEIEREVSLFLQELDDKVLALKQRYMSEAA